MTLNELRDEVYENAEKHGFHETPVNLGESLMLVVSKLSEALEADRNGKRAKNDCSDFDCNKCPGCFAIPPELFEIVCKGTVEEKITDAIIRPFEIVGTLDMDLNRWVKSKMTYNKSRISLQEREIILGGRCEISL